MNNIYLVLNRKIGDAIEKLVLAYLVLNCNGSKCEHLSSIKNIADDCEVTPTTVIKKLKNLERKGFINIHHNRRPDGSLLTNGYTVNMEKLGA